MENNLHFVFIINGHNGAGKDEFVSQFIKASESNGNHYKISNVSTIDPIKKMINIPNLWNGIKDEASRQLMHDIKEAVDKYNNFTTVVAAQKVNIFKLSSPMVRTISFVHCREPEKIQQLIEHIEEKYKDTFMIGTILVRRDSHNIAGNAADQNVENFKYDITINNNSTLDDLYEQALSIVKLCNSLSGVDNDTPSVDDTDDWDYQ